MHASQHHSGQQFTEIPRRIFQTWKVRAPLPAAFEFWSSTIKEHNEDYEYVIWDDADNRQFVATYYPWFIDKYNSYEKEIFRVDAVRYFELFHFGGFYLDLDVECLQPLDRYLPDHDVLVGQMGHDAAFANSIPNAIMASKPRQEFWLYVMSQLMAGPTSGDVETVTGPRFLKACIDSWNQQPGNRRADIEAIRRKLTPQLAVTDRTRRITILPPEEWYPLNWNDPDHQLLRSQWLNRAEISRADKEALQGRSTLITYWAHSWDESIGGARNVAV
jgi:inositol phosphorylceramide mannosyltransferase catalytic subunit